MVQALPASEPTALTAGEDEWDAEQTGIADEVEAREAQVDATWHNQRLDRFLVQIAPEFSRNHLQSLIDVGCVKINGLAASSASRKLHAGQNVRIELQPTAESRAFKAEVLPLDIVYEDEHVLVLNKAAGMVVHPASGNWSGTVMNGLLAHHPAAAALPRAGIVHRLDKDTTGLMMVGKSREAVTALTRMIAAREVHREYLALVFGRVPEQMEINAPIRRDLISRVKMAVLATGKPSRTDVYALGVGEEGVRSITAVHCVLHSGRTHQIRVHLAYKGYPLVADALYGGVPALGMTRQALHAARLGFTHPVSGEALQFDASLPQDLASAWALLGLAEPEWPSSTS
ncbi:RluA family pseudouridine synthase [Paucibacter sp. TC2R-5]|uniref:RluA family pseudouridine synthase n=1 Tax=Paucibacter sp. TC2R-5 TaxID=2893555 RepID=UPI0021E4A5B3|nr:RluA family pseudouridine synthase [Paucibacter sp. TC2R-5]MCV2357679.1 RluA family pseudouridine synthase [Paucibacter sp. TC2R-5]